MQDIPSLGKALVVIDAGDVVELFHMLRSRGPSSLKRKLIRALQVLDPDRYERLCKASDVVQGWDVQTEGNLQ